MFQRGSTSVKVETTHETRTKAEIARTISMTIIVEVTSSLATDLFTYIHHAINP